MFRGKGASVQHSLFAGHGGAAREDFMEEVSSWEVEDVDWFSVEE